MGQFYVAVYTTYQQVEEDYARFLQRQPRLLSEPE